MLKKILMLFFTPLMAFATTTTTSFPINLTAASYCTISYIGGISFSSYTGNLFQTTGNINVTCTNTTPWTMAMNAGTTSGGTISQRLMNNNGSTLPYFLYKDSGYTTIFGDGTTGSTVTGTGIGSAVTTTVYGKIPAGYYPTPGTYTDTVTITVTY